MQTSRGLDARFQQVLLVQTFWNFQNIFIQSNFDGSNPFGTMKIVRDSGSSSHGGLLLVPYQEA